MSDDVLVDALTDANAYIASLRSQNQALQERNAELERRAAVRVGHMLDDDHAALSNQVAALQERAERAERLLQAIAFDDQGKLQAWLQPLYIREPYVTVLVDKATKLLSPTQETDPDAR